MTKLEIKGDLPNNYHWLEVFMFAEVGFHPMARAGLLVSIPIVLISRRRCQNGTSVSEGSLSVRRRQPLKKTYYVIRNYTAGFAHSDGAWRTADLATQPELGVRPERRAGLDSDHFAGAFSARQDLNRRGLNRCWGVLPIALRSGPGLACHLEHVGVQTEPHVGGYTPRPNGQTEKQWRALPDGNQE